MYASLVNLAAGYLLSWCVNTPEGRRAAARAGKSVMTRLGQWEKQIAAALVPKPEPAAMKDMSHAQDQ